MSASPFDLDVLVEGTNLGSDTPVITESELENRLAALAGEIPDHAFVQWLAQNIDRTVTLYRAAKRSGGKVVVDLYAADVPGRGGAGVRAYRARPQNAEFSKS